MIHGSRHDDGHGEVADAVFVDGERDDLIWLVRKVKQINTGNEKLKRMKTSKVEAVVVFSDEKTLCVIDGDVCS